MKLNTLALSLALSFAGATLALAQNPHIGSWKLNADQSKVPAHYLNNSTVVYDMDGDKIRCTTDGADAQGKPVHTVWTGKFDGKPYPVTGDDEIDTRSYKAVDDHTLAMTNKKAGKVVSSGTIVLSSDGMHRTLKTTGLDGSGKKVSSVSVYDKQM